MQGLDYAYTLQGWLKGVNSATGTSADDMGRDSVQAAKDAFAYSLGYYTGDYNPIGGTGYTGFKLKYKDTTGAITGQSLYNGNISNTTLAVNDLNSGSPVGYTYHYDQLNRLKKMRQYNPIGGGTWSRNNIILNYQENVTYDGNGNILTYGRNGDYPTTAQTIDSLSYVYTYTGGKLANNKLQTIHDAISSSGYALDLRNQTAVANYRYNPIGQLTQDLQANITGNSGTSIVWSVYGKPLNIYKTTDTLTFAYNPGNQRVSKTTHDITTWYVRDAQGNVLGVYDNTHGTINWREQDLYGSSRLGIWLPDMNVSTGSSSAIWDTTGHKQYELDNHLGNVLSTVTDKRLQVSGGSLYFTADVASAQDYYPFGMLMPARQYTFGGDSTYRYGFNGKENDNTVKGLGNQQDYGERIYDTRVGRFLSVDPLSGKYPWYSSYQFAGNKPIKYIDADGREEEIPDYDLVPKETNHLEDDHLKDQEPKSDPFPGSRSPGEYIPRIRPVEDQLDLHSGRYSKAQTERLLSVPSLFKPLADQKKAASPSPILIEQYSRALNAATNSLQQDNQTQADRGTGEVFYRTMSAADFNQFTRTGKVPATGETFISTRLTESLKYTGVTVEFTVKLGTLKQLEAIGVRDNSPVTTDTYPFMQWVKMVPNWTSSRAYFKEEHNDINIGLGKGTALDIFNNNIRGVQVIK